MAASAERAGPSGRLRDEAGNTLVLMPAAVLVLLILGAIAVDSAILFQSDRRAADVAASIANDIAGAVDQDAFFRGQAVEVNRNSVDAVLGPERGGGVVADGTLTLRCTATTPGGVATVTCTGRAPLIFAPALPGGRALGDVRGTARATAVQR